VIDDGSSDATAAKARAAGAKVLRHPFNLGVGAALRSGFRFAADRGYRTVIQIDADGQHDAGEARRLLQRREEADADIAVGSRFTAGYEVGRLRRASMRVLSRIISKRLGVTVTDTTSGFRAFGTRAIERFARAYPSAYLSDTVEALLLASDWDLVVVEEPVQMHPRQGGAPSAGGVKSLFHLARLFMVIALHSVRRPLVTSWPMPEAEAPPS
jgi:glycosyltransferase involved in cell wall biosynthesis